MCIRDSKKGSPNKWRAFFSSNDNATESRPCRASTSARPAGGRLRGRCCNPSSSAPVPVSYTHLDVYKRQGCNSMLGAVRQGAFYEFSLKARKGCLFSLKRLALVLRVQPDGPKAYILTYSTDGEHFIDIGAPVRVGSTGNDGKLQKPIDL